MADDLVVPSRAELRMTIRSLSAQLAAMTAERDKWIVKAEQHNEAATELAAFLESAEIQMKDLGDKCDGLTTQLTASEAARERMGAAGKEAVDFMESEGLFRPEYLAKLRALFAGAEPGKAGEP